MPLEELQRHLAPLVDFTSGYGHWFLRTPSFEVKGINYEPAVLLWTHLYGAPDGPIRRACGRTGCCNPDHWEETGISFGTPTRPARRRTRERAAIAS